MAAYATADDIANYKDARRLGDLVSDDGTRVAAGSLSGNAKLEAALEAASGEVESAVFVGERYSTADLSGLTGNSLAYLKKIVCDIAYAILWERKAEADPELRADAIERSQRHLKMLRSGERIFDVDEAKDAGLPKLVQASRVELDRMNYIRDRTRNFFPERQLPGNR